MNQPPAPDQELSEEEMRAALEEEMRRITVDDLLIQTVVSLINLAGRKAGLAPGSEDERDLVQVHSAIEGCRALVPLLEARHGDQLGPIRDALSQLQMAYAQMATAAGTPPIQSSGAGPTPPTSPPAAPQTPSNPPPQQPSRLWIPGQ
ncbi:MAG: hypothetical protein NTV40_09170 [Solirubrobacterales bacterium]|nr:hypothetical protein [Solirubrobacterales bacterium]